MKNGFCLVAICSLFTLTAHAQTPYQTDYLGAILDSAATLEESFDASTTRTLLVKTVGPALKTYSARVANCARGLTHIRVKVARAAVTVKGGGATFSDGTSKTAEFSQTFQAGYVSPWIDIDLLGGGGKCVRKVYVLAHSAEAGRSARVEVQGRYK